MLSIREFERTDQDYEKAIEINNAVWQDYPDTVAEWKDSDERRSEKLRWARFLAEVDGQAVGLATYGQAFWMYHPQKFWIGLNVMAEYRRRGIGAALYERLLTALAPHDPVRLYTHTREDFQDGLAFLAANGFQEVMREWESRLDPSTVDLNDWQRYDERLVEAGIQIKTVRQLEDDPERDRKLYDMCWLIEQDVPSPEPPTREPFEEFQKVWKRPNLLPDAWFVAVHNGDYVGMSDLHDTQALDNVLYTGLTGVIRSYRHKGIATALKLRAIRYAQDAGIREIRTWNEENNQGMLGINIRLGFVRQPAHIEFVKRLKEEGETEVADSQPATA